MASVARLERRARAEREGAVPGASRHRPSVAGQRGRFGRGGSGGGRRYVPRRGGDARVRAALSLGRSAAVAARSRHTGQVAKWNVDDTRPVEPTPGADCDTSYLLKLSRG